MDALNEYTMIEVDSGPMMGMGARDLLQVPWVFFAPRETQPFTPRELENLGKYLSGGGFLMADAGLEIGSTIDIFIRQTITDALSRVGKSVRFKRLRDSHPIYHSFFDFDGPPPAILAPVGGTGRDNLRYMVGVKIEGRWASVISYQNLAATWDNATNSTDSSRHLQFGINTVVFALVQEGGITPRLGLPER